MHCFSGASSARRCLDVRIALNASVREQSTAALGQHRSGLIADPPCSAPCAGGRSTARRSPGRVFISERELLTGDFRVRRAVLLQGEQAVWPRARVPRSPGCDYRCACKRPLMPLEVVVNGGLRQPKLRRHRLELPARCAQKIDARDLGVPDLAACWAKPVQGRKRVGRRTAPCGGEVARLVKLTAAALPAAHVFFCL